MSYFNRWRSRSADRAQSQFAFAPIPQPLSVNVNNLAPESGALSQQPLLSPAHRGQEVRSAPPGPAPSNPPPPIPSRMNRPAQSMEKIHFFENGILPFLKNNEIYPCFLESKISISAKESNLMIILRMKNFHSLKN